MNPDELKQFEELATVVYNAQSDDHRQHAQRTLDGFTQNAEYINKVGSVFGTLCPCSVHSCTLRVWYRILGKCCVTFHMTCRNLFCHQSFDCPLRTFPCPLRVAFCMP